MSDYKIQVCKPFEKGDWKGVYRFMVVDPNDRRGYPANYVCMLPQKIYNKGKPVTVFVKEFGANSLEFAVELVNEAIRREKDIQAKHALEKRLRSLTSNSTANKPKKVSKEFTSNPQSINNCQTIR